MTTQQTPTTKENTMTTLLLTYLDDDDATEINTRKDVDAEQLVTLSALGRRIVEAHGEFSAVEIAEFDDVQLARLGASSEMGGDAYSLACADYLAD